MISWSCPAFSCGLRVRSPDNGRPFVGPAHEPCEPYQEKVRMASKFEPRDRASWNGISRSLSSRKGFSIGARARLDWIWRAKRRGSQQGGGLRAFLSLRSILVSRLPQVRALPHCFLDHREALNRRAREGPKPWPRLANPGPARQATGGDAERVRDKRHQTQRAQTVRQGLMFQSRLGSLFHHQA
jgi:hypothetical protein